MLVEMKPEVTVVIPNYNGLRFLPACLSSLAGQQQVNLLVTIVDNGSTDGSLEYIEENHPEVQVLPLPENMGFSAAVNAGIRDSSAPYIFLLNNDTELPPDCVQRLLIVAEEYSQYGFFAPKMLSFSERSILDGAGDGFLRGGAGYRLGTMEPDSEVYNQAGEIFGACAGAVLYRSSIFEQVDLFDEDFFAYLEDVDLNLRMNRAGIRGYYVPKARVYHIGSATSGSKFNPFTIRLSTRNSLYVLLKNYPLSLFIRFLPVISVYQACWLLFTIKKGQFPAWCQGIWQALKSVPSTRKKYHRIEKSALLSIPEFASSLKQAEREVVDSIMRRRTGLGKGNSLLRIYGFFFLRS